MNTVKKDIELLAPVGSMDALYAAVQNGANAVYLGGKLFNARHYASNFDYDELKEVIKYAHLNYIKVYVTVNILIDDKEIEDILEYIKFLYEIDVDALIVQDLGVAKLIRTVFPDFDIHGSTQMTINNLPGAKLLEEIGFTRVVLARETPIQEIKKIKQNSNIELEVFVHGALCVAYSGQCLMSSLIGGRSGNRGRCAQPCRMPYSIVDKSGNLVKDWQEQHVLSTRDLNTLQYVDELKNSGVTSLKVEGRMKRPEYVATIIKNYRKAIDKGSSSINNKDVKDIEQIFNRNFTKGLTFGDFGNSFISYDRPDNRGSLLGKVIRVDKYNMSILLEENLKRDDGIEFTMSNGQKKGIKSPVEGKKGSVVLLEKRGHILKDSYVYKTSSHRLLQEAKESYESEQKRYPINMEVDIKLNKKPKLRLLYKDIIIDVEEDFIAEKAEKAGLNENKIKEQMEKLGDTHYYLEDIKIYLEEDLFLPISVLNELRRNAIEKLEEIVKDYNNRFIIDNNQYNLDKERALEIIKREFDGKRKLNIMVSTFEQYKQLDLDKLDRIYLGFDENLEEVVEELYKRNKEVFIWTNKILYGEDLKRIDETIRPVKDKLTGISVSNIGSMKYFRDQYDLTIHGDIGLNSFNSHTVDYLYSLGLGSLTLSPELTLEQIRKIQENAGGEIEVIAYGYLPAMVTKTCPMALVKGCKDDKDCLSCNFAKGYGLKDRMDMTFYMTRDIGFSTIYNSVPLMVIDSIKSILNSGISDIRLDFTIENENINEIQSIYYDYINDLVSQEDVNVFISKFKEHTNITKGHYYRGIL